MGSSNASKNSGSCTSSTGNRRNRRFVYADYLNLFNDTPRDIDHPEEAGAED